MHLYCLNQLLKHLQIERNVLNWCQSVARALVNWMKCLGSSPPAGWGGGVFIAQPTKTSLWGSKSPNSVLYWSDHHWGAQSKRLAALKLVQNLYVGGAINAMAIRPLAKGWSDQPWPPCYQAIWDFHRSDQLMGPIRPAPSLPGLVWPALFVVHDECSVPRQFARCYRCNTKTVLDRLSPTG